jgi:catechol 2,3-dioxygenase-like lactoylglutathione lyase family enzyme
VKISIVPVPVADQQRAAHFYTEQLGFRVVLDDPMGPERRWVMLAPPGGGAAITLVTWFPSMPPGSLKGVVYEVDDVEAVRARLAGGGVVVGEIEQTPWGTALVQLDDPDGNGLVLQQSPPGPAGP